MLTCTVNFGTKEMQDFSIQRNLYFDAVWFHTNNRHKFDDFINGFSLQNFTMLSLG
jgi:hypothetical protein